MTAPYSPEVQAILARWLEREQRSIPSHPLLEPIEAALAHIKRLEGALETAIAVAEEARKEWDEAPAKMRAGKLLIALGGGCPGYRADIDAIHSARALNGADNDQG